MTSEQQSIEIKKNCFQKRKKRRYDDSIIDEIDEMALEYMTNAQIAVKLGVPRSTLYYWREQHSEVRKALDYANDLYVANLEEKLFESINDRTRNPTPTIFMLKAKCNEYREADKEDTNYSVNLFGQMTDAELQDNLKKAMNELANANKNKGK